MTPQYTHKGKKYIETIVNFFFFLMRLKQPENSVCWPLAVPEEDTHCDFTGITVFFFPISVQWDYYYARASGMDEGHRG